MLSHVGEVPPLQDTITPIAIPGPDVTMPPPPLPVSTAPPADLLAAPQQLTMGTPPPAPMTTPPVLPTGMGMDALPARVTRPVPPQPTFAQILMKSIPMLVAGIAASRGGPAATTGLLSGYAEAMERRRLLEEKQHQFDVETAANEEDRQLRRQQYQAAREEKIVGSFTSLVNTLKEIDDPALYAATVSKADEAFAKGFGTPKGFITSQLGGTFSDTKRMAKAQKDAQTQIDKLQTKWGEQFNDLLERNDLVQDATGKDVPIQTLWATAGLGAKSAEGKPLTTTLPKPKPKNEFEQGRANLDALVQQRQREWGRSMTTAEIMALENEVRGKAAEAVRAPTTPTQFPGMIAGSDVLWLLTRDKDGNVVQVMKDGQPVRARPPASGGGLASSDRADVGNRPGND